MGESNSALAFGIIFACVLIGIFITKIKINDVLSATERSVLGIFRSMMLWTAILAYAISSASLIIAFGMRIHLINNSILDSVFGLSISTQLQALGMLTIAMNSFFVAAVASLLLLFVAVEMHLRRIARQSERSGYFND